MKRFITTSLMLLGILGGTLAIAASASAQYSVDPCTANRNADICKADSNNRSLQSTVKIIINILLWVVAIVSTIGIIVGGIMYATSSGDQGKAKNARNAIIYSVIGLAVAVFAYAIVQFVITRF